MRTQRPDEARLGDVLMRMGTITQAQLTEAVDRQSTGDPRPLGVLLIELGYADARDVQLALLRQQALRGRLPHEDGMRLLDEACEQTQRTGDSIAELTAAAEELRSKTS
jgi:hypothetical protein